MAVTKQEIVRRLPTKARAEVARGREPGSRSAKQGPDVVVNDIDVTLVVTAPFAFALPQRFVDWLIERFGVGEMEATVSTARRPPPRAAAAPKQAARKASATKRPRRAA